MFLTRRGTLSCKKKRKHNKSIFKKSQERNIIIIWYLKPIYDPFGKGGSELPHLLQRQTVHVENDDGSGDLRFRFHHGGFQKQNDAFENFVQITLRVLPFFSQFQKQNPSSQLISRRQNGYYVLLENVFLLARNQTVVNIVVFDLESVVPFDLERNETKIKQCDQLNIKKFSPCFFFLI